MKHMVCPRAFLGNLGTGTLFFFFVKDRPVGSHVAPIKHFAQPLGLLLGDVLVTLRVLISHGEP